MYKCPINYYTENIIFNEDKSCWGIYKLTGYDYDFLNKKEKIAVMFRMSRFLAGVMSEVQILIQPVEQDIKTHYRALKMGLDREDVLHDTAMSYTEQVERYLQAKTESEDSNDYRAYIVAKLCGSEEMDVVASLQHAWQYFIKSPVNAINVYLNTDTTDVLVSKIEQMKKTADDWLYKQNQRMSMVEVQGEELQWIFRRISYRGLREAVPLFYQNSKKGVWKPKYELNELGKEKLIHPWKRDVVNLFSGSISSKDRVVRVQHDKLTSYQTFLAITGLPDEWEFPGQEWIYTLQKDNQQAEVCIHIQAIDTREARRKIDGKKQEIDSQVDNAIAGGAEIPEDLETGKEYAAAMEAEIKTNKDPILKTTITICVAADQEDLLEERTTRLREMYQDMNFVIERPIADQIKLFMSFIPTVGITVKDYVLQLTPTTLASGVIGANRELGDGKGWYIGTTGEEDKNVYLNMALACLLNKSASATFYGNLGFGKSFNANLIIFLTVLYGGYGLIFDPKGERSHWESQFTMLKGLITTVTLSADTKNTGMLDPYNIYRDNLDEANELALNVLTEMFGCSSNSMEYTALLEATKKMTESEDEESTPSMMQLAKVLDQFPEEDELCKPARMIARRIRAYRSSGMTRLLIGEGGEKTITLDNRLNILQIQNLKLPSPETPKSNYTTEENVSTVIMMVLSHFAKKFALVKRNVFSQILFDESWALGKTAEGVKMYDFLTRMGRSLFTGCIFNGHSVLDLPTEGIKNTISYKFCFCTTNESEAVRMCEYMGLEVNEQNKATLMNLQNGECMFQDLDKHVGILKFDAVFQDIIEVFSTTPKTKKDEELLCQQEDVEIQGKAEPDSAAITENIANVENIATEDEKEEQENKEDVIFDFLLDEDELPEAVTEKNSDEGLQEVEEMAEEAKAVEEVAIDAEVIEDTAEREAEATREDTSEIDYEKIFRNLYKREKV